MGSIGQNDGTVPIAPSSGTAAFVLGADGPSPGRKGARRVSGVSKIPLRPAGVNSSQPSQAGPRSPQPGQLPQAVRPNATTMGVGLTSGTGTAAPATSSAPTMTAAGLAPGAGPVSGGAFGGEAVGRTAMQMPVFAVGAMDGQPVGIGTPRGSRARAAKHKAHGTTPTPPAPAAAAAAFAIPFSPIALTPMDENTYQKFTLRPDGTSPMDITPQGSVASSMASAASNVFVFSPLVGGGVSAQAAGAGGGAGPSSAGPMVSPAPFQGFTAMTPEASPSPMFSAASRFAAPTGPPSVSLPTAKQASQPFSMSSAGGFGASSAQATAPAASGTAPAATDGPATNASGLKFPIQIPIPGAREVQNMFSVASTAFGSCAPASAAPADACSKVNAAPAVAPSTASSGSQAPAGQQMGGMAAAVAAAASKKLPEDSSGGAGDGIGSDGNQFGQAGNDCQPAKDNAPKPPRMPADSAGSGAVPGVGMSASGSGGAGPSPPQPSSSSDTAAAQPPGESAPAVSAGEPAAASNQPLASGGTSAMDTADVASPDVLAALAEQLENMARRAREAAAAAVAAKASAKDPVTSSPAVRTVIEMMLRPGTADAGSVADAAAAPGPMAAAVASLIGGLKLDDPPAGQPRSSEATTSQAAPGVGAPSAGSAPAATPSVPFVFGGSTPRSNAGSGGVAGFAAAAGGASTSGAGPQATGFAGSQQPSGTAPGPAPSVPFVFGASGNSPMARVPGAGGTSTASTIGGMGSVPFQPFTAAAAPTGMNPQSASSTGATSNGFASVPFMFGAAAPAKPAQPAAAAAPPGPFAAGVPPQPVFDTASSMPFSQSSAGPSPMSTTPTAPTQQPPLQPTASSSSGWANAPSSSAAASGEAPKFTMGASTSGVGGSSATSSSGYGGTPGRAGRTRPKITPRKVRVAQPTASGAHATAAGPSSASNAAASSTTNRPAPTAASAPSVGTSASAGGARPSQPQQPPQAQQAPPPQPQQRQQPQTTVSGDGGLDSLAVQAIRIKRSADEKKQYGNQKYEQSDFRAAERWYTEAIEALEHTLSALSLPREKTKQLFPTLQTEIAVLYSNRSGARLMTSKPQSALEDALKAMALDPKFMRAASRAATCHCRLGDFAAAHRIIDLAMDRCSASSSHYQDMLRKLNEVVDLGSRARAATAAAVAAVATGSRDKLQEAADQLAALRDQVAYCDVIAAARAVLALRLGCPRDALALVAPHPEVPLAQRAAPWRLWLTVQARYFRGDLQEALTTCRELHLALQASTGLGATAGATGEATSQGGSAAAAAYTTSAQVTVPPPEVLAELADNIQQQLKLKEDGNAAIKAGRHSDAAEHYTRALALGCSPAFAALLHANRAAAHTSLGQVAEAVADCGRARALDPSYYKASARLASLMIELRRPENAMGLLDPLVKLGAQADGAGPAPDELAALKDRLNEARSAAKWMKTPHHYKMLGLTNSCSEEEVRKAYRRLALKHHPDKATASVKVALALPGAAGGAPYSGALAGSSELETRMREEASWLFNLINQAHEELSDKARRRKVDQLLDVEQPPSATRYTAGTSASNPYANWFSGTRYSGFSSAYGGPDPFFSYRSAGGASAGAGSARGRTSTGSGTSGTYGYGTYNASRPSSSRPAGASNGGTTAGTRPAGNANAGAARSSTAGSAGGYSGFGRNAGSGAGARTSGGGRKWWEGGYEDSDDDDQDTFNF